MLPGGAGVPNDIKQWLEAVGLERYRSAFSQNEITLDDLPEVTEDDLKEMGLPIGPRRRALKAIAALAKQQRDPANTAVRAPDRNSSPDAERRLLTVLFADLVGSTELSLRLDPEDLREVMRRYQDAVAGAITRYDGHLAKYLGDGVLAYFGWPQAYEDQAERSVWASLDIVAAVAGVHLESGERLSARIGIASGQVVIGDLISDSSLDAEAVTGETPNLAARLQGEANPGQIVISASTRRLVGNVFELAELGPRALKGYKEPVPTWRVVGEGRGESQFEAKNTGSTVRMVGREQEFALLHERWELAKSGEGQTVLLSGEAGIGKSRIVDAVRGLVSSEQHFRLRYQCSSFHANSAFHPVIHQLERAAGFAAGDSNEGKLEKLEKLLAASCIDPLSVAPLFASLLSLSGEARYGAIELTSEQRRDRTFTALVEQVLALSRQRPVLFLIEDVHWIDPTSQDYLSEVISQISGAAVFVLVTHRPDFDAPWRGHPHLTSLTLNRLSRLQASEIVKTIGAGQLADAVVERIVARADGVPLYVEELTKTVLEASDWSNDPVALDAIPPTLQASLTARLDRLETAKYVAQIGAAIGREFSYELIKAVSGDEEATLVDALETLVGSELVFRIVTPRGPIYSFKHALIQEVAYDSLLKARRAELHARIANILAAELSASEDAEPEVLARHYSMAGMVQPAIDSWRRAGELSAAASANIEAVIHFDNALALVETMQQSPERDRLELGLRVASGGPLLMTRGHGALEVGQTYSRAHELCKKLDDAPENVPALFGLWRYYVGRGDCNVTRDLGRQILQIGEESGDRRAVVLGHYGLGYALFCHGDLEAARTQLEAGYEAYDERMREDLSFRLGQDPGVACLAYLALALWVLGFPEQARQRIQQALTLAENLSHPFSQAYARSLACQVMQLRGEVDEVRAMSDKAIEIALEQGFGVWIASPTIFKGWARARLGESHNGSREAAEATEAIVSAGMSMRRPYYLALVADGLIAAERWEEARATLDEAQAVATETDESWSGAEITRLEGILTERDGFRSGEVLLRRAVDLSRETDAKSWELRAALSLARLLGQRGEREEANSILRPVYEWFSEGFDTVDLQNAKALLDELS